VEAGVVRDKIVVPRAAVQSGEGGSFVWIVNDDVAHKRDVQIGANSGERIEITNGVNAGDKVVLRGAEKLTGEMAKVRLVE
jgi:multidrug efflux system membrane fusion protein